MVTRADHPQAAVWSLYQSSSTRVESPIVTNPYRPEAGDLEEGAFAEDHRRVVERGDFADGGKFRSVVKILAAFNNCSGGTTWMMGSGWLISPDTVVTAGHVVYDWKYRYQRAREIKCYIGYAGRSSVNNEQYGVQARLGERVVTTLEWVQSGPQIRTHDVAFIKLDRPFKGDLRMFPVQAPTPVSGDVRLGVVGYPGDKELPGSMGEDDEGGALMYEEFARTEYNLQDNIQHMIEYRVSTYGGQSGGPVLKIVEGESLYVVIGTHCFGFGPGTTNSGTSIGGRYGVDYDNFIVLFDSPSFPHEADHGIKILSAGETTKTAASEAELTQGTVKIEDSPKSSGSEEAQLDAIQNNHLTKRHDIVRPQKSILDIIGDFEGSNTPAKVRNNPVNCESEDERIWQATIGATLTSRESTWVRSPERRKFWDSNSDGLCPTDEAYV